MEAISSTLLNLTAMVVTLGILVTIHEYGHFIVARLCGIKVERFSIGFGKVLLRWQGKPLTPEESEGTEYVISALPLGGYVKMLGEQEEIADPGLRKRSFTDKTLLQRTAVVAAGPIANFLLAIVIYCGLFFYAGTSGLAPVVGDVDADGKAELAGLEAGDEILSVDGQATSTWRDVSLALLERLGESGFIRLQVSNADSSAVRDIDLPISNWQSDTDQPDLYGSLGITPYHQFIAPLLEEVFADGRAEQAGLRAGDLIISADGEEIANWNYFRGVVQRHPEQPIALQFERDGLVLQTQLVPSVLYNEETGEPELTEDGSKQGVINARVAVPQLPAWMSRRVEYSLFEAVPAAISETASNSLFVLDSIRKMLLGQISVKNLSGPITIAQVAGETASSGITTYVGFLALLSISLGVFNLLPIPVLDGGHLFYNAIEAVIRRPVPRRFQEFGMQLGMLVVAFVVLLTLFNDVNRLL